MHLLAKSLLNEAKRASEIWRRQKNTTKAGGNMSKMFDVCKEIKSLWRRANKEKTKQKNPSTRCDRDI